MDGSGTTDTVRSVDATKGPKTPADELKELSVEGASPSEIRRRYSDLYEHASKQQRRELDQTRDALLAATPQPTSPPPPPTRTSKLTYLAAACAVAALAVQPLVVGVMAIAFGFGASARGDRKGRPVAAAAALTMSVGMIVHALRVNAGL